MRFAILMLLALSTSFVEAQDFENQMKSLLEKREKEIAEIEQKFMDEFSALRQKAIASRSVEFEASMKSLDLENSNRIKSEIDQLTALKPKYNKQDIFVNDRKSTNEDLRFIVKCVEGLWLESGLVEGKPIAVFFREVSSTKDYVEIKHENGFEHRIHKDRVMSKSKDQKTFQLFFKGRWLEDVEIDYPWSLPGRNEPKTKTTP